MKRVLSLLLLISVSISSWAVSFEDSNFRVDSDGFFERKNRDATIADAANLARRITLEHLKPRVYDGEMTTDDLRLLQFCFYVMGMQAEQTYELAAYEMGLNVSGRSVEYVLNDIKEKPQAIGDWHKIKPLPHNSKLESFARSYSTNQFKPAFFNCNDIRKLICTGERDGSDWMPKVSPYKKFNLWKLLGLVSLWSKNKDTFLIAQNTFCNQLKSMPDRISYQKDVLENANSPYRRAYMDLLYVASLIDYCRSHKWDGLEVTDIEKKMWDEDFEKCFVSAKEKATSLEKIFVTYPLMMEYCDLNACILYYWYLESEFGKRDIISKAREDYLHYASYIADMGSRYAAHSTDPISIHTLEDYNEIFQWSFSTNKIDITDSKIIDEEFSRLVKNTSPILDDKYESQVKSALVDVKREIPQTDVMMSREEICENKYLKDVVGGIIGGKNLDDWCRLVEKMNEWNWLYPTWCDEIKVRSNPPKSEDIVRIVRYYRNEDAGLWVKTVAEALLKMTGCSDEMKSLMEIVCDEDELDEMKDEILDTIDDRKLTAVVEQRINNDYGLQEKMVDTWLEILSDKSMPGIEHLRSRVEKDILNHWKMIQKCEKKAWWNPSRWF